jgi:mRNA-degrading endonuclease toxin of MazEF toxin-antitoxin module
MKQGEIYWADLDEGGRRLVIVVSREELNRGSRALVVPCTSQKFDLRSRLPNCVPFRPGQYAFTAPTVAQCENAQLIDKSLLDLNPIARIDDVTLRDLILAMGYVFDADCEPT